MKASKKPMGLSADEVETVLFATASAACASFLMEASVMILKAEIREIVRKKCNNSPDLFRSIGYVIQIDECPQAVQHCGHDDAPTPIRTRTQHECREDRRDDVAHILVTRPQT